MTDSFQTKLKLHHAVLLCCAVIFSSCTGQQAADVVIHNASIYTVDGAFTMAEAIAIRGDSIVEIGAEHQILNKYAASRKIDAQGRAVFPGFIDAHAHFLGYGLGLQKLDLVGTKSFEEVIDRLKIYTSTHDNEWIEGRGWDQNDWENKSYPTNETLNDLFPDRPVILRRVDGHAMLVNDAVLQRIDISSRADYTIDGGQIILDDQGRPTGVLIDAAMDLVENKMPEPSSAQLTSAIKQAQDSMLQYGLTALAEPGLSLQRAQELERAIKAKQLKMRISAMLSAGEEIIPFMENGPTRNSQFAIRSIKVYCDGALGSRGAWLKAPYADDPSRSGSAITGSDSLLFWAELCQETGFQMNVHCIGDMGNKATLTAMADVLEGTNDLRWRIEHAQVVSPEDVHLFGDFTIIPSVQPTHAISDMPWAEDRLGSERMAGAYAYQTLLGENGMIALGTDVPVESPSPFMTFYTAVERKNKQGEPVEGFLPSEALTKEQALRGMTIWAAIANFQDEYIGSLEVGKKADLVVLDRDWMTCDPSLIPTTNVLLTMINGEVVYENL